MTDLPVHSAVNREGLSNDEIGRKLEFFGHINECFSRYGVTIPPEHIWDTGIAP